MVRNGFAHKLCLAYQTQAKENADDLLKEKNEVETQIATEKKKADDAQDVLQAKVNKIGNIVHDSVPVSQTEVSLGLNVSVALDWTSR